MKPDFTETQRFTQWWLWVILGGVTLIPFYGMYQQMILAEPFGDNPMSDFGLIVFAVAMLGMCYFFWSMRLITQVDENGVSVRFKPFEGKKVSWEEINRAEVVKYHTLGWGIRMGGEHHLIYNMRGNRGLAIQQKNGERFLVGTRRPEELAEVVSQLKELNPS